MSMYQKTKNGTNTDLLLATKTLTLGLFYRPENTKYLSITLPKTVTNIFQENLSRTCSTLAMPALFNSGGM